MVNIEILNSNAKFVLLNQFLQMAGFVILNQVILNTMCWKEDLLDTLAEMPLAQRRGINGFVMWVHNCKGGDKVAGVYKLMHCNIVLDDGEVVGLAQDVNAKAIEGALIFADIAYESVGDSNYSFLTRQQ